MPECWIGIGANVGDARAAFDAALLQLTRHSNIKHLTRSAIYGTRPVGQHAGGVFSNAVFSLATSLTPLELLDLLQQVETELGRTRDVRWGPRPIDLDLLFVDQLVIHEPRLNVPHPAAWYRRFVIDPLLEVAPTLRHPQLDDTVAQLHDRLTQRPFVIGFHDPLLPNFLGSICFEGVQFVAAGAEHEGASAVLRLRDSEPSDAKWQGIPVADLTETPGDIPQRVTDFLTAALDQPVRSGDW